MDGVHDLGGLDGFGPVEIEPDEPVFHEPWERREFAVNMAIWMGLGVPGGRFRHSIERIPPARYLSSSYFENWLTGVATLAVEAGVTSQQELAARAGGHFPLARPDRGAPPNEVLDDRVDARFSVGDHVRVREWHPTGHTRAPRYVQGKRGVVVRVDGAFPYPDVEAHGGGQVLDPTYSVRFAADEVWGDGGDARDAVHVDLWERYLEADP